MTRSISSMTALSLALLLGSAAPRAQQTPPAQQHQHQAADPAKQGDMAAKCQAMMEKHQQMMADMKAADERLDTLVATMESAAGQAKVDATAAVVAELVTQRKSMHERMMSMHQGTMGHMADHMQAGPGSMASCPMMKGMGEMKKQQ